MSRENGNGISKARVVALTDGVFAIVMTLLVLDIVVPHLSHSEATVELVKRLVGLWPVFLGYASSFIILGFFWIGHDSQFHYIKRVNRILLWITIFYLMFIALIPFSTSLLGEYQDQQISVIIYGANLTIALCWNYLHWWYATKNHRLVDSNLDPILIKVMLRIYSVGIIIFLVAIAVSFVNVHLSLILYIAAPLYFLIPVQKHKSWNWFSKNK